MSVGIGVVQMVEIEEKDFGPNSRIGSASVVDPWVLLVLESGRVLVFKVNAESKEIFLEMHSQMSAIKVQSCWCMG